MPGNLAEAGETITVIEASSGKVLSTQKFLFESLSVQICPG
jgi:hypothetical protein